MEEKKIPSLEELRTEEELGISYNIDKITDKIFLGSIKGATDYDYFEKEKINSVLSMIDEPLSYPKEKNINHKLINIGDIYSENISKYFKECIEFIENADKIYVHCACGVSRSASIVISYLMWKTHSNFDNTYFFVKKKRPEIDPNNGFRRQLKKFHDLLSENNYDLNKIDFNLIK